MTMILCGLLTAIMNSEPGDYFKLQVVDEDTGRGVPLVELRTTNELRFVTDSNGIVAFFEPGLMNQVVYFHVKSHGYEFPKDGFGFRGRRLKVTPGGSAVLKIKRINIAERLYRVTGEGIYRDSVLVGGPAPIDEPVLNGLVTGQDSVHATPYRGRIFWIWGDTNRPSYPLGNFGVSGATSELPGRRESGRTEGNEANEGLRKTGELVARGTGSGLDPAAGVNLRYFVDKSGFSRPMIPPGAVPGPGPKWLGGLTTIKDEAGNERLIAKYVRMKDLGTTLELGLVTFNDEKESFERLVQFDLDAPLYLDGHPFRVIVQPPTDAAREYLYGGYSAPYAVRVVADFEHIKNPAAYEGFTPLVAGSRFDKAATQLERGPDGRLTYAWKPNTPPLSFDQQNELVAAGKLKRDEAWLPLQDIDTGRPVRPHAGSVCWNEYRRRWVMIVEEAGGTSNLGEIWFAEADTPVGPWVYARKIVMHDKYSFYNPTQHSFFDQAGGRLIYFEGTYAELFSGTPERTPRYDYNQIMYRLDLADPRMALPVPVYRVRGPDGSVRWLLRDAVAKERAWGDVLDIPFFAIPPDRVHDGTVPVFASTQNGATRLSTETPAGRAAGDQPLFHALPPAIDEVTSPSSPVVPLWEYRGPGGIVVHSTSPPDNLRRADRQICRVWRNPTSLVILDCNVESVEPNSQ